MEKMMGQFLAMGLTTEVSVSKKDLEKVKFDTDKLVHEMEGRLHFNPALYTLQDKGDYFTFHIKDEIFCGELLPFLEKLYPALYNRDEDTDFTEVLADLKSIGPEHWLKLAKEKKYPAFQFDSYGMSSYLDGPFGNRLRISYDSIILSIEGKIIMEEYGGQFTFFQYCIARAFAEFTLSGAMRVYITG